MVAGVAAARDDQQWWEHYWDDALLDPNCSYRVLEMAACGGGRYLTPAQAVRLVLHPNTSIEALCWCVLANWDDYTNMCAFIEGSQAAGLDTFDPAEHSVDHAIAGASLLGQAIVTLATIERDGWNLASRIRTLFGLGCAKTD
jgi:hypothetical protein